MRYNLSDTLVRSFGDLLALFFPKLCVTCSTTLTGNEDILCTACRQLLPETNFHHSAENPVSGLFWGRIPVEKANSLLFFDKGSKYRQLLYHLKYKGRKDIGIFLGNLLGSRLMEVSFDQFDLIVPVPLHPVRQRRRGFNQSEIIAMGISEVTGKKVVSNALRRSQFTTTQTRKGRFARWQNVEGIFTTRIPATVKNRHVLLIDDVVTTGATLEAAGNALLKAGVSKLSVATAAFAHS